MSDTKHVSFTKMEDGTQDDYEFPARHEADFCAALPERILTALENLRSSFSGYKIDRLEHSLQTATRAHNDGADIDWVVSALVHDLGDDLPPLNNDSLAAAIVAPYVRENCTWVMKHHGIFHYKYYADKIGLDPEARQKYAGHPHFDKAVLFCERWDQESFDPDYEAKPLSFFEPMVREVFSRPAWDNTTTSGAGTMRA